MTVVAALLAGAVLLALGSSMTAVAAVLVLAVLLMLAWQRLFDGRLPPEYVEAAVGRPFWLLVLGGAAFSLVNAAVEEAVFRGVLQTALERVSGPVLAVVVPAVAFGLLHVVGVPTGIISAIMAGTWGLLLGVMTDERDDVATAGPGRGVVLSDVDDRQACARPRASGARGRAARCVP